MPDRQEFFELATGFVAVLKFYFVGLHSVQNRIDRRSKIDFLNPILMWTSCELNYFSSQIFRVQSSILSLSNV